MTSAALRLIRPMNHPRQKLRNLVAALKKDGAAALVLLAIAGRSDERQETFASAATLADDTGLCRRTVQSAIARLRALGVLTEEEHAGRSTIRRLSFDAIPALPTLIGSPVQPVAPVQPIALVTRAAGCTPPVQPVAPEEGSREVVVEQNPQPLSAEQVPSPSAPPPAATLPGLVVVPDVENPPEQAPARKKRVGIRTKRVFPPEVHAFVESFREDFRDNVQADFEFRKEIAHSELAAAAALMRDSPPEQLQLEKAWIVNDKREDAGPKDFPGWAFVIRSVANWRDKREKIRNAMRREGVL